ncbi:MAG TPA: hypothetical protein VGL95_09665 [Acetobacteraceae bacterium]
MITSLTMRPATPSDRPQLRQAIVEFDLCRVLYPGEAQNVPALPPWSKAPRWPATGAS